ncbi:RES family NAD+ phosphorylase [Lysobacter firmicutimachus]|uniref:RES family NAD+ phosphorylase n=1 Tax=Lysobacter firmicutimachus TaxID=1792846 RepID=A0AAU8MSL6_9GAMM
MSQSKPNPPTGTPEARPASRDKQLADSFPASDPPSTSAPQSTEPARKPPHLLLYRVVAAEQVEHAFDDGPGFEGGRWTSPGRRAIYASLSPAGALLEFVAHLDGDAPRELRMAVASVPADCVHPCGAVPEDWDQRPYREHVRRVGDCWLDAGPSFGLFVPSALSPRERNVLLNLGHEDRDKLDVLSADVVALDERLCRR